MFWSRRPWSTIVHEHRYADKEVLSAMAKLEDLIKTSMESIMIDTTKILAEVARERTDVASLRALSAAQSATMKDLAAQLAAAIAANDPAAMAKVQADLDQAATDLSTDNDATEAAITANTPAA